MSTPHDESDYHIGSMDISAHRRTYEGFITLSKYSTVGILLIMVLLAIFRTN